MTSSANLRPPRAAVRTTRIRATLALAAGLAIMLAVPAAARAAAQADGWFGYSVAVSGDTVVVGASGEGSYAGAAYVFIDDAIFADGFDGDVAGQGLVVQD